MLPPGYSNPVLAVPPRGYSPLVILAHMLAHPSGRLRRCSLRTYGSTVHLPRLRARLSALRVRLRRMFPSKQSFFGASLASRIHAFNALARPSAIPSAYRPRPSKASLFRRLPGMSRPRLNQHISNSTPESGGRRERPHLAKPSRQKALLYHYPCLVRIKVDASTKICICV